MIKVKNTEWKKWVELNNDEKIEILRYRNRLICNSLNVLFCLLMFLAGLFFVILAYLSNLLKFISTIFIIDEILLFIGSSLLLIVVLFRQYKDRKEFEPFLNSLKKQVEVKY